MQRNDSGGAGTVYTCPMHPEVRQDGPGSCPKCGMALEPVTPPARPASKVEYTCPMHPEIVRDGPGSCPICGMALEPRTVTRRRSEEQNPELRDMRRRFWVGAALPLPLLVLGMSDLFPALSPARTAARPALAELGATRPRHAGGALGRVAVLRARLGVDRQPQPQHVHPDRPRHRRRLRLQPGRNAGAGPLSAVVPRARRAGRPSISRRRPSSPRWSCSGRCWSCRARSQTSGGDPRPARPRPQDRAPASSRRRRGGRAARPGPDRRPPAGAAGREGAGGRRRDRRPQRGRRIDDHRASRSRSRRPPETR